MNGMIVRMSKEFDEGVVTVAVFPDRRIVREEDGRSQETNEAVAVELRRSERYPSQLLILRSLEMRGWVVRPVREWEGVEDERDLAGK